MSWIYNFFLDNIDYNIFKQIAIYYDYNHIKLYFIYHQYYLLKNKCSILSVDDRIMIHNNISTILYCFYDIKTKSFKYVIKYHSGSTAIGFYTLEELEKYEYKLLPSKERRTKVILDILK